MAKRKDKYQAESNKIERDSRNNLADILDLDIKRTKELSQQLEYLEKQNITETIIREERIKGRKLTTDEYDTILKITKEQQKKMDVLIKENKLQDEYNLSLTKNLGILTSHIQEYWKGLMASDKSMKEMILDFGLTGKRADDVRTAIEGSAVQAARLGASTEDLTKLYSTYVEQTGRVVAMNDEQLVALTNIAKGTGLSIEQAGELAGKFEMAGKDAVQASKNVQGILDVSERMGVNATKVLKVISENYKKLQTYTFRKGVEGMGSLASYAEKFKIDITTGLASAEKARTLDSVIEMGAKLQVLGGEFAKLADPLQMFYEGRNDLEAYNKRISEMTKGMTALVKTASGFEYQVASPMARDMLKQAGDALGFNLEQMTDMSLQQQKLNDIQKAMVGTGYNKEQRELIQGMAQLNSDTGKFFVTIGTKKRDLKSLTADELGLLVKEKTTLQERAKAAQTFDQQFEYFILELKAVGLPLLRGINDLLTKYIKPAMDGIAGMFSHLPEWSKTFMKSAGFFAGIGALLLGIPRVLDLGLSLIKGLISIPKGIIGMIGKGGVGEVAGGAGKSGFGAAAGIAAVGVAAAGIGVGINLATKGISALADAFSKLDPKQISALNWSLVIMGGTMIGILVPAVIALGSASELVSLGLLAFGAAAVGVGFAINLATKGVGAMAEGFADLLKNASPLDVLALSGGMTALAGASALFANPLTILGLGAMALAIGKISSYGAGMEQVGNAFEKIGVVLSGTKGQFGEIEESLKAISTIDFSNINGLSELTQLLKQPIKVEFADKNVGFVANIDLDIDGTKLEHKLNLARKVEIKQIDYQTAKSAPRMV